MIKIFSRESLLRHWSGLLWLLPSIVLGIIYDGRSFAERVRIPHGAGERAYEYHLTPFTTSLGHLLPWFFWGGIIAFVLQAIWQGRNGAGWFLAKVLFLPIYFVLEFLLFFHTE